MSQPFVPVTRYTRTTNGVHIAYPAIEDSPNELVIAVWATDVDLVAGSRLVFENAAEHELKGVPARRRMYRVVG